MRQGRLLSIPKRCAKCQDIASPSLSGSVAKNTSSAPLASFLSLLTNSPLPRIVIYLGSKSLPISTPRLLLGRSRMCPTDASTLYPLPKNFLIVLTFAWDSTITSFAINLPPYEYIARQLFYHALNLKHREYCI